jgi:hypothetical protein
VLGEHGLASVSSLETPLVLFTIKFLANRGDLLINAAKRDVKQLELLQNLLLLLTKATVMSCQLPKLTMHLRLMIKLKSLKRIPQLIKLEVLFHVIFAILKATGQMD